MVHGIGVSVYGARYGKGERSKVRSKKTLPPPLNNSLVEPWLPHREMGVIAGA